MSLCPYSHVGKTVIDMGKKDADLEGPGLWTSQSAAGLRCEPGLAGSVLYELSAVSSGLCLILFCITYHCIDRI